MQVQAVFAEALAVIRQIDERRCDQRLVFLQDGDQLCQHMVGVDHGVVVGVDDRVAAAALYVVLRAIRSEAADSEDREGGVEGKDVAGRVGSGGGRLNEKKK